MAKELDVIGAVYNLKGVHKTLAQRRQATVVYHLTYTQMGGELLVQLVALCQACHEKRGEFLQSSDCLLESTKPTWKPNGLPIRAKVSKVGLDFPFSSSLT